MLQTARVFQGGARITGCLNVIFAIVNRAPILRNNSLVIMVVELSAPPRGRGWDVVQCFLLR